jgi:hypothetical protein
MQGYLLGLIPFALVALVQFYRSTGVTIQAERRPAPQLQARPVRAGPKPFDGQMAPGMSNSSLLHAAQTGDVTKASEPSTPTRAATTAYQGRDASRDWPMPTVSSKRLLDGSPNWLPVPNADGPDPDDIAWQKVVKEGDTGPCPAGRRPYHTILTAQNSLYQQWQTKIFYYHFRRVQREGGRCGEMTGFTRLLAGREDELVQVIPTVVIKELGFDKTRGFPVINRPWTLMQVSLMPPIDHPLFISLMVACSGSSGPTLRSGSPRTMCTLPRRITCCGSPCPTARLRT